MCDLGIMNRVSKQLRMGRLADSDNTDLVSSQQTSCLNSGQVLYVVLHPAVPDAAWLHALASHQACALCMVSCVKQALNGQHGVT